jgi:hypothetical protein
MVAAHIMDFPVEIVAKLFDEMDVEDAWTARGVCRYWKEVFELVAYGSKQSPLTDIRIGVDAVCAMKSVTGTVVDTHVVHGDVKFDLNNKSMGVGKKRQARWTYEKKRYEYWPGGKWRKYEIGDVLTDVKLQISGLQLREQPSPLRLGSDVGISGKVFRPDGITEYTQTGEGKFGDFVLLVDTVVEPSPCGRMYYKHCVNGLLAPKWQIYALIVHHHRSQREIVAFLEQHYVNGYTSLYRHVIAQHNVGEKKMQSCGEEEGNGWMNLPPRWNFAEIQC